MAASPVGAVLPRRTLYRLHRSFAAGTGSIAWFAPDQEGQAVTRPSRRFVVGISGASGAAYALRLLELLLQAGHEVHLVVTRHGRRLLLEEAGIARLSLEALVPAVADWPMEGACGTLVLHADSDVGASIASGSFPHDGMVVVPCSSASLGSIASGSGQNLLTRAALVTLKERRPLILCHRETPLSLVDIENMRTVTLAGAIVCPTNPGLYLMPTTVAELVDFIAGKVLDLLGVEHALKTSWDEHRRATTPRPARPRPGHPR